MAQVPLESGSQTAINDQGTLTFQAHGADRIELPSPAFIADAAMTRDGSDLILETPSGETAIIEGYFSASPAPTLVSGDGAALTPNLVKAFAHSAPEYAANDTATDESPVGAVEEVKGNATVTRGDGTVETITIGTPIYQGDVIQTDDKGAVNISFIDETTMAVSENARLSIDEYTFDPASQSGTTNFSVLRGLFVFTSGLIGRDDPDDVTIDTPVGSIGIRGTIIAGDINPTGESKVTVLEGAIVVKNSMMEETLSVQFETVRLGGMDHPMESMGAVPATDISSRFSSIGNVSPTLFTTINDAVKEQSSQQPAQSQSSPAETAPADKPANESNSQQQEPQPAPMQNIVTLHGNTTGLNTPSSTGHTTTPSPNVTYSPVTNTPSVSAPVSAATPNVADTTQLPPQLQNSTGTNAGQTTPTPSPLSLSFANGTISDIAAAGTVIGTISAGTAGVTYTLASTSPYYTLLTNGDNVDIILSTGGKSYLASSLDALQLGSFTINATHTDGRTTSSTYTITTSDTNAASSLNMNAPASANINVITDTAENNIGYTITALGDINNDGFDDFAFSNNIDGVNYSYIAYGNSSGISSDTLSNLIGTGTIKDVSNPTNVSNTSNTVIAGIGDFNGDGMEDYVVGQSQNNTGVITNSGQIAIVSGSSPMVYSTFVSAPFPVGNGSQFGYSVDGIKDFNNDGYADVIIGAPGASSAFLIRGSAGGLSAALTSSGNISGLAGSSFGTSVKGIGDFNGDGYSDFAVGDPNANSGDGQVRIYLGNKAGTAYTPLTISGSAGENLGQDITSLGDINGDGKTDIMISGGINVGKIYFGGDTTTDSKLSIPTGTYTLTGGGGIGDFNGDGYDDFTVALSDSGTTKAYVVFGKSTFDPEMNLDFFKNPANAMEIKYDGANNTNGLEFSALGDINGDGYDDFGIGLPDGNGSSTGNGGVAIVYGRNTGHTGTVGTSGNDTLSDNGLSGVSMRGGAGNDTFEIHNTNFLGIDGGGNTNMGKDVILAMGNLDFSNLDFEKVSGIEMLKFGSSSQNITLSLENIFNLLKTSDTGSLTIDSPNAGNTLTIDDGAAGSSADLATALSNMAGGAVTPHGDSGSGYNEFSIGGYKLYIDADVTVNIQ